MLQSDFKPHEPMWTRGETSCFKQTFSQFYKSNDCDHYNTKKLGICEDVLYPYSPFYTPAVYNQEDH